NLQGKQVVVTIDNQSGKEVRLAKDETIGIAIANDAPPVGRGSGNSLANQAGKIVNRPRGNHPDGDLRRAAVESCTKRLSAIIGHGNHCARAYPSSREHIGPVNPNMPIFKASSPATRYLDSREGRRNRLSRHASILPVMQAD